MANITGAQLKDYMLKLVGTDEFVDEDDVNVKAVDCRVSVEITQDALDIRKTFTLDVAGGSDLETELLKALKASIQE
jgi:hypothetical protein